MTFEDKYHIHKTLGILSVVVYMSRMYMLLLHEDMHVNITTLMVHGMVNMSSFIFKISNNRHATLPIIYPESRLYNMLFVFRSILCCLCFYYKLHIFVNMLVCLATMCLADVASGYYKSQTMTMRLMPYMSHLEGHEKKKVIKMHSFMQIIATYYMLENINTAYSPIFAIQISAFLMTLAKKGFIHVCHWHYWYSLALWLNILCLLSSTIDVTYIIEMNVFCCFMYHWRIVNGMNKYAGWMITFAMHYWTKSYVMPYVLAYTSTLHIFYVYLFKYTIISNVLHYYHIRFEKELIYVDGI